MYELPWRQHDDLRSALGGQRRESAVDDRCPAHFAAAAELLKLEIREFTVRDAAQLPDAFNSMGKARIEALLINNESFLNSQAGVVAALAAVKQLPAVGYSSYADVGGLLAYGANRAALYRRTGHFVDRVFRGDKPADIPFERATKFDVVVNRRTARSLAISIPQSLLVRADRVID